MNWNTDLLEIKGIGEKTVKLFHKLDLYTVKDLLYYLPRDYEEFKEPTPIADAKPGEMLVLKVRIPYQNMETRKAGRFTLLRFYLTDPTGRVEVTYFNMPYLKKVLQTGTEYVFRGRLEEIRGRLTLQQPKYYTPEEYQKYLHSLQPVYTLTKGLTGKTIQKTVKEILKNITVSEVLPEEILKRKELFPRKEAFVSLHFPKTKEELLKARERLVFEEFLAFCISVKLHKNQDMGLPFERPLLPVSATSRLVEQLPYRLTGAQQRVWKQLEEELQGEVSMNRLIQGDVGSGKTILAVLSLLMTAANGRQGAFMAPTEVLARQHYDSILELSSQYGLCMTPVLLVGSMTAKDKREAYEKMKNGQANVIVGTHALIQEKVEYQDLALVITDEQHRFGVRQRQMLQEKGYNTHVLVMSATPIPRTLAIILFGDLQISVLDEMPEGRLPIKNCVVGTSYREKAYQFMKKEIGRGHQIYVICPMVEEGEMEGLENVLDYTEKLRAKLPAEIQIGYLHGKMKPALKNQIMEEFSEKKLDILVSTTVIEVGINVPNATVMMVENAERFGLAQLHQLRGRVGRGKEQSYCIFINGNQNEATSKRLELLNQSNDGFFLANEDLKLRGPGDIFGMRQSGNLDFHVGDIYNDASILLECAALAEELLKRENGASEVLSEFDALLKLTGNVVDFRSI